MAGIHSEKKKHFTFDKCLSRSFSHQMICSIDCAGTQWPGRKILTEFISIEDGYYDKFELGVTSMSWSGFS